tara:strand:+ start:248 stop:373 length:126 start_codon:yes stop_codon:yes gene_type:complete
MGNQGLSSGNKNSAVVIGHGAAIYALLIGGEEGAWLYDVAL